ncbi:hypothetical protein ScPMuIL_005629 [Solemya velum]
MDENELAKCMLVGSQPKRYKLYETDNAESIPKTTQWRLKQRNQELPSSETGQSFNPPPIFESIDPSCTAFDSIAPEEIEIPLDTDKGVNMELEDDNESEEEFLMSESDLETSSEEEDNSCEPQVSPEELSSDPPLYIIPPSSTVYHSNISRTEHVFAISAFATRHNMSDTALHDLLQLIQLHLPDNNIVNLVELWGPLWAWSCFCFESFNGEIKKAIHGTGNVCRQIFWTCQAQKRVEVKVRQLPPGNKVRNYMQSLLEANLDKLAMDAEAFQCSVKKVPTCMITSHFAEEVKTQLRMWIGMDQESDFITVSKIVRNGHLMYSKVCAKVKNRTLIPFTWKEV